MVHHSFTDGLIKKACAEDQSICLLHLVTVQGSSCIGERSNCVVFLASQADMPGTEVCL
jgi:hypothetical protein